MGSLSTEIYFSKFQGMEVHYQVQHGWVADFWLLAVSSYGGRDKGVPWCLFNKGTYCIHEGSTYMAQSPLKGPPSNLITLGIRFQYMIFGGKLHKY